MAFAEIVMEKDEGRINILYNRPIPFDVWVFLCPRKTIQKNKN
jgi:hypothetical protein